MSSSAVHLVQLLRLQDGRLPAQEARELHRRIAADGALQAKWKKVLAVADVPVGAADRQTVEQLPTQEVAALIDGTLDEEDRQRVEDLCWEHPALLYEVASLFQHRDDSEPLNEALHGRLMDLFDQRVSKAPPPINGHATRWKQDAEPPPQPPARRADSVDPNLSVSRTTRQRRASQNNWSMIAVALAVIVMLGGAVLVFAINELLNTRVADPDTKSQPKPPPKQSPAPELDQERPRDESPPPQLPEQEFPVPDLRVVEDDEPQLDPIPQPTPRQEEEYSPPATNTAIALKWNQVEGLLAARSRNSSTWQGGLHDNQADRSMYATMPESWARSDPGELGEIVLDSNTLVSIARDQDANRFDVRLRQGRVAFRRLPPDVEIVLHVGQAKCRLIADRDDTDVLVEFGQKPKVAVRNGRALVDTIQIAQGRQIRWDANQWQTPIVHRESTRWLDRPGRTARISRKAQEQLLSAPDISAALTQLARSEAKADRQIANRWSLALFPEESIYEKLTDNDPQVRIEALRWLVSQEMREPAVQRAWRSLSARVRDPGSVRQLAQWGAVARRQVAPSRTELQQMVAALGHGNLAIRQGGVFFLEHFFGKRVDYVPTATPQARRVAAQRWAQVVRRHVSNVQQRQATGNR